MNERNEATTVFVLGILSLILCQVLGPYAWYRGAAYSRACRARGQSPDGLAVGGMIMGIAGTLFLVVGVLFWLGILVVGIAKNV